MNFIWEKSRLPRESFNASNIFLSHIHSLLLYVMYLRFVNARGFNCFLLVILLCPLFTFIIFKNHPKVRINWLDDAACILFTQHPNCKCGKTKSFSRCRKIVKENVREDFMDVLVRDMISCLRKILNLLRFSFFIELREEFSIEEVIVAVNNLKSLNFLLIFILWI